MKTITTQDCIELREKFLKFYETAEKTSLIKDVKNTLDSHFAYGFHKDTCKYYESNRLMFVCILKILKEDYSEYEEVA